jgi:hypothetical protein
MLTENQLNFLREKIEELRSALFFNTSDAVLKLPSCVINTLQVDEAGQLWFFVNRPGQYLHEFDKEFPARLNFFRKGKQFFLNLTGKAFIISDPEELNQVISVDDEVKQKAMAQMVLIKFKITNAEYDERVMPGKGLVQKLRSQLSRMMLKEKVVYKPYTLQPSY